MAKTFEIMYQAAGAGTGLTVQMDVYKPDKSLDAIQSGVATEVGVTGRYHLTFDADAPDWYVEISDNAGGKAVKHFGQEKYDAHGSEAARNSLTTAVANVQTAVDAAALAIANLEVSLGVTDSKVDTVITGVVDLQTGVLALSAALATIDTKIDGISAPPMVG